MTELMPMPEIEHAGEGDDPIDEAELAAAIETARAQIADGSLRGFSDKDELREELQRSHRRSA